MKDALKRAKTLLADISKNDRNPEEWMRKIYLLQGDVRHLPLNNDSINLSFNWNYLFHMNDEEQVYQILEENRRVLKQGGLFILRTHTKLDLAYSVERSRLVRPPIYQRKVTNVLFSNEGLKRSTTFPGRRNQQRMGRGIDRSVLDSEEMKINHVTVF